MEQRFCYGYYRSGSDELLASGPIPMGATTENMLKFIDELRADMKSNALVYLVPGIAPPETATEAFIAETKWRNSLAREGLEDLKANRKKFK